MGIELLLGHSTDMFDSSHYILRLNLIGGAWLTKETPDLPPNEETVEQERLIMHKKRLETNRLTKIFEPDHAYGGFSLKIRVKPEYTGLVFARAGQEEDSILAVKDNGGQGKEGGVTIFITIIFHSLIKFLNLYPEIRNALYRLE